MNQPIGRLTTALHWRAATLPKWGLVALWNLQYSPFRVTYCGFPLRPLLEAKAELQDAK